MSNHYRICFFKVKGFPVARYSNTTAEKADHYVVLRNNKCEGNFTNIKNAIELIAEMEGRDQEMDHFLQNMDVIKDHAVFDTVGITYVKKYGLRLEQKIRRTDK